MSAVGETPLQQVAAQKLSRSAGSDTLYLKGTVSKRVSQECCSVKSNYVEKDEAKSWLGYD